MHVMCNLKVLKVRRGKILYHEGFCQKYEPLLLTSGSLLGNNDESEQSSGATKDEGITSLISI